MSQLLPGDTNRIVKHGTIQETLYIHIKQHFAREQLINLMNLTP